ncbi:hypothetical protein EOD39_16873 [Acipenser ruthenus]|uniref:Uncharacterized protein n=1 Tax=Acipenser ruthenus TaxID=7906 RepID=A0A444V4V8_ACIRT|nr:hypothetical protein EOD39_16873 [Acipenser ruthenus]
MNAGGSVAWYHEVSVVDRHPNRAFQIGSKNAVFTPSCGSQSGQDYYEYYKEGEETEGQLGSDLVEQLQFPSSLDKLLDLLYPEYRLLQQCLHRKAALIPNEPEHEEAAWGYVKEAPLYAGGMTEESLRSKALKPPL